MNDFGDFYGRLSHGVPVRKRRRVASRSKKSSRVRKAATSRRRVSRKSRGGSLSRRRSTRNRRKISRKISRRISRKLSRRRSIRKNIRASIKRRLSRRSRSRRSRSRRSRSRYSRGGKMVMSRKSRKSIGRKRQPSDYNKFVKKYLPMIMRETGKNNAQAMKDVAKLWRMEKNKKGVMGGASRKRKSMRSVKRKPTNKKRAATRRYKKKN